MKCSRTLFWPLAALMLTTASAVAHGAVYKGYDIGPAAALDAAYDGKSALVVIRYPAGITQRAQSRFNARYDDRSLSNIFYRPIVLKNPA
jgi:hypothetical protein